MMISETDRDNVFSSHHDLIEDLSDRVILLRYVSLSEISMNVSPAREVVKMSVSSHCREIKPYDLKQDQEEVCPEAYVFWRGAVYPELFLFFMTLLGEAAVPEGMRRLEKNHQVLRNERGGYPQYFHDT